MNKVIENQDDIKLTRVKKELHKIIETVKTEESLGITIGHNEKCGYATIKRIRQGSLIDRISDIKVGDYFEQINDKNLVGAKHSEVAKILKDIPVGAKFTIKLIEPLCIAGNLENLGDKNSNDSNKQVGQHNMHMKSVVVGENSDSVDLVIISKINNLLELFMGIDDTELAHTIWEIGKINVNPSEFANSIKKSEIGLFQFNEEFIFDLWGAIDDAKAGRLQPKTENEH